MKNLKKVTMMKPKKQIRSMLHARIRSNMETIRNNDIGYNFELELMNKILVKLAPTLRLNILKILSKNLEGDYNEI